MKHRHTILFISMAAALGAGGLQAGVISLPLNGDFQSNVDCPLPTLGWTVSTNACITSFGGHDGGGGTDLINGNSIGPFADEADWTATSDAIDVAGCSPYGVGEWAASGYVSSVVNSNATGVFGVDFEPGSSGDVFDTTIVPPELLVWSLYQAAGGNIPEFATSVHIALGGNRGSTDWADAYWDDIVFTPDCVTEFMKVSGKIGSQRGLRSFSGLFYKLESQSGSSDPMGTINVNYKTEKYNCDFFADDTDPWGDQIVYADGPPASACLDTEYQCYDGSNPAPAQDTGTAQVCVYLGEGGPNSNAAKRGDVCVDADQNILDVPADDGASSEDCSETGGTQLNNGNTDIMEPAGA